MTLIGGVPYGGSGVVDRRAEGVLGCPGVWGTKDSVGYR